jgi:hypothetical protein
MICNAASLTDPFDDQYAGKAGLEVAATFARCNTANSSHTQMNVRHGNEER